MLASGEPEVEIDVKRRAQDCRLVADGATSVRST